MSLARYLSKLGTLLNSSGQVPAAGLASGAAVSNIGSGGITANELATVVKPLGVGQTWQAVTGSRTSGTTYTNSTGKSIMVMVSNNSVAGGSGYTVGGVNIGNTGSNSQYNPLITFLVPAGATYLVTSTNITLWAELR